jgi:hypothetical protein
MRSWFNLVFALVALCVAAAAGAQRDSKETINSIGRRKPAHAPKAAARKPAVREIISRPAANRATKRQPPPPTWRQTNRLVVSPSGKADFKTIGEALKKARPGAQIVVRTGVYRETLVLAIPVSIAAQVSSTEDDPILEGATASCIITVPGAKAILKGFTLRCPESIDGNWADYTVEAAAGRLSLVGCSVLGAEKGSVHVSGSSTVLDMRKCTVRAKTGPALTFADNSTGMVEDCSLSGGKPSSVLIASGADPMLRECQILDSPELGILSTDGRGTIVDCTVRNATMGVVAEGTSKTVFRGGMITECRDGAQARYGGHLIIGRAEIHNTKNAGVSGAEKGRADIKDCNIHDVTPGFGVHADVGGTVSVEGGEVHRIANSGIWADKKSNLTVVNVNIHDVGWEGITVKGDSQAEIRRCTITGSAACGIGVLQSKAQIYSCKITDGKRHGIGLTPDATVFVMDCTIQGNTAGGISAPDPKRVTISDSRIQ